MKALHHLLSVWPQIRLQIRDARELALFTDFDGTLVRIQRNPEGPRLSASARRLLREIAATGATVGVLSGRRLEDVEQRVGVRGIWYAGAHGFFLRDPSGRRATLLKRKDAEIVARAQAKLARLLEGLPGVHLESKGATVAVHYRAAPPRSAEFARAVIVRIRDEERGLHLMEGKKVWEFFANASIDKASALRLVLRRARRTNPRAGRVLIYLGDDTTDERVFEKMRGISVAVGKHRHTAARYFLRSPAEVRRFLARLRETLR